ncbi:hypothetical protein PVAP13_5NG566400 [Panicum virgatum]|uniref:RING-type E3 ubiquitin transferase n=1 Tax=Panicum virgatum TaxID=38727 RepID=A0A8T0S786_PANVG|nr:hypothetical protein PVAP13_5NG566400 [Panicum virgatum]
MALSIAIPLGVLACIGALGAVIWAARCCCAAAKEPGGGGGASATGKHEGLLNKSKDDVAVAVGPQPGGGGGGEQQRGPGPGPGGDGDVELCAICKARLAEAEAGWGGRRRLRPCGHVYHTDCISLWLQRRWTCPVCRADVLISATEIMDAMV